MHEHTTGTLCDARNATRDLHNTCERQRAEAHPVPNRCDPIERRLRHLVIGDQRDAAEVPVHEVVLVPNVFDHTATARRRLEMKAGIPAAGVLAIWGGLRRGGLAAIAEPELVVVDENVLDPATGLRPDHEAHPRAQLVVTDRDIPRLKPRELVSRGGVGIGLAGDALAQAGLHGDVAGGSTGLTSDNRVAGADRRTHSSPTEISLL